MNTRSLFILSMLFIPLTGWAADSIYCPQRQGYINVGMTDSQVVNACGEPIVKQTSNQAVVERIPVTQLMYTTLNQGGTFPGVNNMYQRWSLPSGSTGTSLTISIRNNRISGVSINGASTNAATLCGGINLQIGDMVNRVYSACGTPSLVNQTYINQPVPKSQHPERWIYQVNPYQPSFTLTFINGKLQSID